MRLRARLGVADLQGIPAPDLLLNIYPDAEVAHSLDKLDKDYTGSAVRVRRSSDNQEQDIGFVDNLFDSASLETFVTEEYDLYTSDFSSSGGLNGLNQSGTTITTNYSIGGEDDAARFFVAAEHSGQSFSTLNCAKETYSVTCDVYIPSTNVAIDKVTIWTGYGAETFATTEVKDEWVTITGEVEVTSGAVIRIQALASSGSINLPTLESDEAFYIKNFDVTTTATNAYVTTWYDQSGNAVNATQSTASGQPKIAVQGSYLGYIENINTLNNATLNSNYPYVAGQRFTSFIVGQQFGYAVFGGTQSTSPYYGVAQDGSTNSATSGFEGQPISYFGNGNSVADVREDIASLMVNMALLTTLGTKSSGDDSLLAMGYVSQSFNNCRFKEYIIYNNQSVNREEVEAYIMEHYNL
jgi:hypothetical protein